MAVGNIEIEMKFRVDEKIFLKAKDLLNKTSRFVKTSHQTDEYFTPSHRNFLSLDFPIEWLSLRKRDDKQLINYKHLNLVNPREVLFSDEFETVIEDIEKMKNIFSSLDFRSLVTVDKKRDIYIYNDEFEVVLDFVRDLGYFMEIETIKDFGSVENARYRIMEFAKSLDLNESNIEHRGYPLLMLEKDILQ
ncbi:MAG: class IV adenylate cyclase [Candidatus Aenigmarchaeota archaeon]|nr:class IV adenylate cyclase [Candidatus Aenigmarchaeota archaeon]